MLPWRRASKVRPTSKLSKAVQQPRGVEPQLKQLEARIDLKIMGKGWKDPWPDLPMDEVMDDLRGPLALPPKIEP